VADEAATRLPTICCVDLVTFLTVDTGVVLLLRSGGGTALTVSGDATVLLSAVLTLSSGCGVERNQPFTRDCAGDVSGLGDSEGNEVRLLVSTSGEGARLRLRLRDVLEERFEGRMRCMLRFRGLDMVELCEAVRTRSTARGGSIAAMFVESHYKHAHSCSRRRDCVGANMVRRGAVVEMCVCIRYAWWTSVLACMGSYASGGAASYGETIPSSSTRRPTLLCMCEQLQKDFEKCHVLRGRQSTRRILQVMKTQGAPAQTRHDSWVWVVSSNQSFPSR
jgi:hypothetical protein